MPGAAPSVQATAASMKVTITENDNARGIISFNSSTVRGREREEGEEDEGNRKYRDARKLESCYC